MWASFRGAGQEGDSIIADYHTYISHYKREKKYAALEQLLTGKLAEIRSVCTDTKNKNCDLEGELYVLDDLADIYTYGLINFDQAKAYNRATELAWGKLNDIGLEEVPISNYFNDNRFLYYTFYAEDSLFGEEHRTNAFDDNYIRIVRENDFYGVSKRIKERRCFLNDKIGTTSKKNMPIPISEVIDSNIFLQYLQFIDSFSSFSPFEKAYHKARAAAQALSTNQPDKKLFLDTILSARSFCQPHNDESISLQNKKNQLAYWITLAFFAKGDGKAGLAYHTQFLSGIRLMEQASLEQFRKTARMLDQHLREELDKTNNTRNSGKKIVAGLASGGVVLFKTVLTALAAVGDTAIAIGSRGRHFDLSLTEAAYKGIWKGKEWDWGANDVVMEADFLNPVYATEGHTANRFKKFMTPYTLLLNRYLDKYQLVMYMLAVGDAYWHLGKLEKAKEQYKEAIKITEKLRITTSSENERVVYFGFKQSIYTKIVRTLLALEQFDTALEYVERSKARAFLDILGSDRVELKSSEQNRLASQYFQSRAELDSVWDKSKIGIDQVDYSQKTSLRGLQVIEKSLNGNSYDEIYSLSNVKVINRTKMQNLIDSRSVLVEYYFTDTHLNIFVIQRNFFNVVQVSVNHDKLSSMINEFRQSIAKLNFNRPLARKLYKTLINPIRNHLNCDKLIIIPHKSLHYLPFQALMNKSMYLAEEFAISYVPSATILSIVTQKGFSKGGKALVIGNPTGDLVHAEKEAIAIGKVLPDSEVIIGDKGTETRLKKNSDRYKVIHIASHGLFDPNHPLESMIKLSPSKTDDGRLMTDELFSCRWRAGLVTLSACESGISKYSSGDELVGLQRGIFFAGTQSLLASSWKVDDKSTSFLMRQFYRYLADNTKDISLQKAQIDTMREYPQPFYWASFNLIGSADRVYNLRYPVNIILDPPDAKIKMVGTNKKFESGTKLEPGEYTIQISRRGCKTQNYKFNITDNAVTRNIRLDRIQPEDIQDNPKYTLLVNKPPDSFVVLMNTKKYYSPNVELVEGLYEIRVSKYRHKPQHIWIDLKNDTVIDVTLEKE